MDKKPFTAKDKKFNKELAKLYEEKGFSIRQICEMHKMSYSTVRYRLSTLVKFRSRGTLRIDFDRENNLGMYKNLRTKQTGILLEDRTDTVLIRYDNTGRGVVYTKDDFERRFRKIEK